MLIWSWICSTHVCTHIHTHAHTNTHAHTHHSVKWLSMSIWYLIDWRIHCMLKSIQVANYIASRVFFIFPPHTQSLQWVLCQILLLEHQTIRSLRVPHHFHSVPKSLLAHLWGQQLWTLSHSKDQPRVCVQHIGVHIYMCHRLAVTHISWWNVAD